MQTFDGVYDNFIYNNCTIKGYLWLFWNDGKVVAFYDLRTNKTYVKAEGVNDGRQ